MLSIKNYYAPLVGKGAISVLSVRPSRTQQIIREPKGIACPNLEERLPPLMRLAHQFKGQKVTRSINAHTHRAPYLPNGKTYELQSSNLVYGWRTTARISHRRHDLQRSRSQGLNPAAVLTEILFVSVVRNSYILQRNE